MTSSDDSYNSDNSSELSKDAIKLNINSRSLSVYERYLKQTLASESFRRGDLTEDDATDAFDSSATNSSVNNSSVNNSSVASSSATTRAAQSHDATTNIPKPTRITDELSEDERAFFDNLSNNTPDQSLRSSKKITKQKKTTVAYEDTATYHISEPVLANNRRVLAGNFNDKPNNTYRILTIIAVFCVLLLIAIVIVILNANNSLVALGDRLGSVNSQMSAVNKNISVIGQETSLANAQALADKEAADTMEAANAARLASVNESLNTIVSNIRPIEYKSISPSTTRLRSMNVGDVNTEPTISYDDFKNESQTTLYRESR